MQAITSAIVCIQSYILIFFYSMSSPNRYDPCKVYNIFITETPLKYGASWCKYIDLFRPIDLIYKLLTHFHCPLNIVVLQLFCFSHC